LFKKIEQSDKSIVAIIITTTTTTAMNIVGLGR
jgi:hypothetical protein